MGKIKFGRALGLSLLSVLSLMAVFAVSAQATAGEFQIEGKSVTTVEENAKKEKIELHLLATVNGTQEASGILLVPLRGLTITCGEGKITSGEIETAKLAKGAAEFSKCVPTAHPGGGALSACTVGKEKGIPQPIIANADILPLLHEAKNYVTADPQSGSTFTEIIISGSTCAFKGTYPVTGSVSAEVTTNNAVVDLINANPTFSELVKDTLKFGEFAATVKATVMLELTGEHKNLKFGVV